MNSFKLNLDMNMVNCVLLLVVIILVLVCCYNKEQFQSKFITPNCDKLYPCVNGGVERLPKTWNKGEKIRKCQDYIYRFPEDVFQRMGGDLPMYKERGRKPIRQDISTWANAKRRSCRNEYKNRQSGNRLSNFCRKRKKQNSLRNNNKLRECGFNRYGAYSGSMYPRPPEPMMGPPEPIMKQREPMMGPPEPMLEQRTYDGSSRTDDVSMAMTYAGAENL
tara:strand:- start:1 stop:660 length:660 start_codon:yes stop_codon:yes gene_type:complete